MEIYTKEILIKKQVYLDGFELNSAEPLPTQIKVELLVRDIDRNNQSRITFKYSENFDQETQLTPKQKIKYKKNFGTLNKYYASSKARRCQ